MSSAVPARTRAYVALGETGTAPVDRAVKR